MKVRWGGVWGVKDRLKRGSQVELADGEEGREGEGGGGGREDGGIEPTRKLSCERNKNIYQERKDREII